MIAAYKYLVVADGLIVVFPVEVPNFDKGVTVRYHNDPEHGKCISLGENHLIPIDDEIIKLLEDIDKLYVCVSKPDDCLIDSQGSLQIDKITVGKILAYAEMG